MGATSLSVSSDTSGEKPGPNVFWRQTKTQALRRYRSVTQANGLTLSAIVIAVLLTLPLFSVASSVFLDGKGTLDHLMQTVLGQYIRNTLALFVMVGVGTAVIGVATAWLVTMCQFPGRRLLQWALILPLTVPAYVIAYAYTDFLQHPGFVQTLLRDLTGWGPRDYWFPNIRSLGGAGLIFTLVLYPYVYILARAAFLKPPNSAFNASRTLGRGPWRAFFTISLPMARPAIIGGMALALMETLADYGAVAHFGVPTFTTGIYRTWFAMGDRIGATQLAAGLVTFVFVLVALERINRGSARRSGPGLERQGELFQLSGLRAWTATIACALPACLGFLLPVAVLFELGLPHFHILAEPRYVQLLSNSFTLALAGSLMAVMLAVLLAYAARLTPGSLTQTTNRIASLGYAVPGSIVAVGILLPLAWFDTTLDSFMRDRFGISTGLLLTGSIMALLYGYMVRFIAVALNATEASLSKVTPAMDGAARTLGSGAGGTLLRVHMPIIRGGLLGAGLIVFVDSLKELPATLIMRPFNFDTLAVQAHRLASDERLAQAAVPSLVIVAVALLPVILISQQISRDSTRMVTRPQSSSLKSS